MYKRQVVHRALHILRAQLHVRPRTVPGGRVFQADGPQRAVAHRVLSLIHILPSIFVRMMPVALAASMKLAAWLMAFWPVMASSTSSASTLAD